MGRRASVYVVNILEITSPASLKAGREPKLNLNCKPKSLKAAYSKHFECILHEE